MKKVLAFGSFDLLHPGHIYFLKQAKKLGKKLIVCVTRDAIYKKQKGHNPLFNEKYRKEIIRSLKMVDKVILGNLKQQDIKNYKIIEKICPDVLAVGYDQKIDKKKLKAVEKKVQKLIKVVSIMPYRSNIFNSSGIKKALKNLNQ